MKIHEDFRPINSESRCAEIICIDNGKLELEAQKEPWFEAKGHMH